MLRRSWGGAVLGVALLGGWAGPSAAQVTGTPTFHAPYRAFSGHELGASVSFLENSQTAFEALYRVAIGSVDLGARLGGVVRDNADDAVLAGLDARIPVLFHESGSPLDGALVTGVGVAVGNDVAWWLPVGFSVARRLNLEGSDVSLVPYVQPTGFLNKAGAAGWHAGAGLGFGLDLRLTRAFEVRVSGGVGTTFAPRGVAVTAVWLR
jgi:hypothetical protein